ncbi:MAG: helix-hairpin-helix domain-containing protein [Ignavibacteriae bacterium]|nr:helix-hairpin-helix domain-containing protein [Ignavibacteriota bacterium]
MMQKFFATSRRFGFTRNEAVVVLFLSITAMCGGLVRLFTPAAEKHSLADAYKRHDSVFAARSAALVPRESDGAVTTHPSSRGTAHASETPAEASINLNTASAENLATLPGVGPSIARRIIEYRDSQGIFQAVEDLMNVKGIGPKKFERIKPYLSTALTPK